VGCSRYSQPDGKWQIRIAPNGRLSRDAGFPAATVQVKPSQIRRDNGAFAAQLCGGTLFFCNLNILLRRNSFYLTDWDVPAKTLF
jgi:hypothetical protein